jgi:hypothetical protein
LLSDNRTHRTRCLSFISKQNSLCHDDGRTNNRRIVPRGPIARLSLVAHHDQYASFARRRRRLIIAASALIPPGDRARLMCHLATIERRGKMKMT